MGRNGNRWKRLRSQAEGVVSRVLGALPPDLRRQTEHLAVCFERRPSQDMLDDGVEADIMGLFVGATFEEEPEGPIDLPPQILLFLENIDDEAGGDPAQYKAEVRTTFLHELGHYLGLDEDALEIRGLE